MKATIKPLHGKYYRTEVEVVGSQGFKTVVTLTSDRSEGNPSDRELEARGISRFDWDNNTIINNPDYDSGWDDRRQIRARECEICWAHTEMQQSYLIAKKLCEAINESH